MHILFHAHAGRWEHQPSDWSEALGENPGGTGAALLCSLAFGMGAYVPQDRSGGETHPTSEFLRAPRMLGGGDRPPPTLSLPPGMRSWHGGQNHPWEWAAPGPTLRSAGAGENLVPSTGEFYPVSFGQLFGDILGCGFVSYNEKLLFLLFFRKQKQNIQHQE